MTNYLTWPFLRLGLFTYCSCVCVWQKNWLLYLFCIGPVLYRFYKFYKSCQFYNIKKFYEITFSRTESSVSTNSWITDEDIDQTKTVLKKTTKHHSKEKRPSLVNNTSQHQKRKPPIEKTTKIKEVETDKGKRKLRQRSLTQVEITKQREKD